MHWPANRIEKNGVRPHCQDQPRASRNAVAGWTGETLKLRLTAPPVEGAANAACLAFLADLLDLPQSQLKILKGDRSRHKVTRITGLTQDEVHARLSPKRA